jgi:putative two-component system response regulator
LLQIKDKILLIEDLAHINKLLCSYLRQENYDVVSATNGREGLDLFKKHHPDIVVTDVVMPEMNGFSVCKSIKSDEQTRLTPVILLTSLDDNESYIKGMEAGADDFLVKPVNKFLFLARIKALLKVKKLNAKLDNSWSLLFTLAKAVEAKDKYTEDHTQRVGEISRKFGMMMGLPPDMNESLYKAGILHDIGKIGIPDSILNKPSRLTSNEYNIIKTHTEIGKEICKPLNSMKDITDVILYHHERWDGSGYPLGLTESEIPLMAQIVSIVDVYDALSTDRPYRRAYTIREVLHILENESDKSFNPDLIKFFLDKVIEIPSVFKKAI